MRSTFKHCNVAIAQRLTGRERLTGPQAAVGTDVVAGGCGIRPMPRGIGETT